MITKKSGKYFSGDVELVNDKGQPCKSADEAIEADNKLQAAHEAERAANAARPVNVKVSDRGQIVVHPNNRDTLGGFALISLCGLQFEALIAEWDRIRSTYSEAKSAGKIVMRWQDLPPGRVKGATK